MIKLYDKTVFLSKSAEVLDLDINLKEELAKNTMAYGIFESHNTVDDMKKMKLKFDSLVSPDNNYVSILQTAAASGVKEFPIPYVLSNCHNTLCAVGGTINEDDHMFGLDNVKKYGGIFLPPYKAVLHQYMREMMAGGGKMILGSDSHTRYGALGTLSIGEGGGEIAKQLLNQTYDIDMPKIIAVKLTGKPRSGIGPQDIVLSLIGATFKNNFVKNKVLEFVGEGVHNLSIEYRMGIDVMTTESAALSSIWVTDEKVESYLDLHGRKDEYKLVEPKGDASYDGLIEIDLDKVECMMALPFHPSNVVSIKDFNENIDKYIEEIETEAKKVSVENFFSIKDRIKDGKLKVDQALVAGCCGGLYENIVAMADVLKGYSITGDSAALGINPASQPILSALSGSGVLNDLILNGATIRPCICGPCFGVTDVPANNQISIRHMTRNYPNREGAKPSKGQMAMSILMDARSIAASVRNGGKITPATDFDVEYRNVPYTYNKNYYEEQVFNNYGKADNSVEVRKGPNIEDWPSIKPFKKHLLLKVSSKYEGSVTTDDLSPSGDAVAYRSNPLKLAEFTMINKDTSFVPKSTKILNESLAKEEGRKIDANFESILNTAMKKLNCRKEEITLGGVLVSNQIGDGSSREQAVSSQRILGGYANIANEYATKRYRSNLLNWGMLPIVVENLNDITEDTFILIKDVRNLIENRETEFTMEVIDSDKVIAGSIGEITENEKLILLDGCLINYNRNLLDK